MAQRYNFYYYNKDNGLSQSHVEVVFEDSRGYIWIGTESSGINVFNGVSFVNYNINNGLPDNKIRTIFEDRKGNIWIGMKSGYISKFNGEKFTNYSYKNGLKDNCVLSITEDIQGDLWVGTRSGGLYKKQGEFFEQVELTKDTFDITVKKLFVAANGDLWVGTKRHGVFVKQEDGFKNITSKDGLSNNNINSFVQDKEGFIWIATRYGVSKFNGWNFRNFYHSDGLSSSYVTSLATDIDGNIWFGTYGYGATKFDGNDFIHVKEINGLCNDFVKQIMTDRSGNVWFCTNGGGVCKLDGEFLKHYTIEEGLPGNNVICVYEDQQHNLWMSTSGEGVCKYNATGFKYFTTKDGICSNVIQTIFQDSKGNMWFGSPNEGLSRYDGNKFTNFSSNNGLSSNDVKRIIEDRFNNIWIATFGGGICLYDGKSFMKLDEKNGLSSNLINDVLEDDEGNVWVGTDNEGVMMIINTFHSNEFFKNKSIGEVGYVNIKKNYGLGSDEVVDLLQDRNGYLWIGTRGGGVSRFDGKRITNYTTADGLSSDEVQFLLFDAEYNLWVGTDKGLNVLRFSVKNSQVSVEDYSQGAGFNFLESKVHQGIMDHNENLWFCSSLGVSNYIASNDRPNLSPPNIHLTGIKLFSEETDWSDYTDTLTAWMDFPMDLKLSQTKNHLRFEFFGTDQKAPGTVLYQWKLEGMDADWCEPTTETSHTYSYIPFGNYTFKVRAANRFGVWNQEPEMFNFSVLPPFWANWKFYVIGSIIVLIVFILYSRLRQLQLVREKKILENKVEERTRMLHREKITVEVQKDQLALQKERLELVNKELEKLSIVAAKTSNSVVIFDANTNIEWVNEGFNIMYDYSIDEFTKFFGKSIYETSSNPEIRKAINKCVATKNAVNYITQIKTKSGKYKWLQTTLTPALNEKDQIEKFIAVESDITKVKEAEQEIQRQKVELECEKEKSDNLLLNILPDTTAQELKTKGFATPRYYRSVSVLFTDFKDFTQTCEDLSPKQLVSELHSYFAKFDELIEDHYIEKIKTIGDAYMCVGGVPIRNRTHPFDSVLAGLKIQNVVAKMNAEKIKKNKPIWELRLGIHTGDVVAGVVGKKKFAYDIWGDTVNIAARMEQSGEVNRVNISGVTYETIKNYFDCEYRGRIDAKNKGKIDMYFVDGIKPEYSVDGLRVTPNPEFIAILARL